MLDNTLAACLATCTLLLCALPAVAQHRDGVELRVQPYADGPASALHVGPGAMQTLRLTVPVHPSIGLFAEAAYADGTSTVFGKAGASYARALSPQYQLRLQTSLASGRLSRNFEQQFTVFEAGGTLSRRFDAGLLEVEPGAVARLDVIKYHPAQYSYRRALNEFGWLGAEVRLGLPLTRYARLDFTPGVLFGTERIGEARPYGSVAFTGRF